MSARGASRWLALAALGLIAADAPPPVLEIHNDTLQPVFELYVEPSGDADAAWDDRLEGGLPISPEHWVELPLDPAKGCRYDIEVRTANRGGRRALDVDVCKTGRFDVSQGRVLAGSPPNPGGPAPPPPVVGPPGPLDRGLPICPGDVRCRRKK